MYIKSMVLEGFKSYGKRIEINGFDQEFNAITGLNGSGKSNILDAICFVLGITNLGHVRANTLQELVYKSGQAGIKKASVTIVFDNKNRQSSPMGYEDYEEITVTRQVVIDGKNKYMINGSNVPNKRVQDMFCSVQLNVNNPHFLIMQGRITKVLNMKPPEILSMVEEGAGTKMYETKKNASLKLIEKKDSKLREINELLKDELGPKIAKLKEERQQYMEYQRVDRELQHCRKIYVAWKYVEAMKQSEKANEDVQKIEDKITRMKQDMRNGENEIKTIDEKIVNVTQQKKSEQDGEMKDLETQLHAAEKQEHKLTAELNSNKENIKAEEKNIEQCKNTIKEEETALENKEREIAEFGGQFEKLKEEDRRDSDAVAAAQETLHKISAGLLQADDGSNATLEQQLIKVKKNLSEAQTEVKQCTLTLSHNEEQLKKKKPLMRNTESAYAKDKKTIDDLDKDLKNLDNELQKINYQEGFIESLECQRDKLTAEIRNLNEKIDYFESDYPYLRFSYKDPEPNFRRDSVKGLVCKSISVKDKKNAYALEVAAGAKLYNVMVDTEQTGKKLLQRGQLQQRVTIIPLNKVAGQQMNKNVADLASNIVGKENCQPALSLIDFPEETRPAMEFIFGQVFICKDMNAAKQVAFHNRINKKCITIEGDVCDPSGVLSGGAPARGGSILLKLNELKEIQNALYEKQDSLRDISNQISKVKQVSQTFTNMKQQYNIKKHEVDMVRQRLQQTSHHQIRKEVEELEASVENLKNKMDTAKKTEEANFKKAKELEAQIKDSDNIRQKQLEQAAKKLKELQRKSDESKKKWQAKEKDSEILKLEVLDLQKTISNGKEQLSKSEERLKKLKEKEEMIKTQLLQANENVKKIQADLKAHKDAINKHNSEIQNLQQKKEHISKQNQERELDIKKLHHEVTSNKNSAQEHKSRVADLLRKYEWIKQDEQYFGEKGGVYDFELNDPEIMSRKVHELESKLGKLSRMVNAKAMMHLNQEEEQYNELLKKKKILENDKKKILESIKKLDEKKKMTLLEAYEKVNRDFGSIFSSLLPGADAKLEPPENQTVLEGLEVKIGLNGVWKESLGELSGGQRSLVALSLILAMLLFKPAPLYILDEVDAALDLSHTENIGVMLKRHFKHSQFIVVSLKNGMFNNANVLFKTRFVDGMSSVIRTEKPRSSR